MAVHAALAGVGELAPVFPPVLFTVSQTLEVITTPTSGNAPTVGPPAAGTVTFTAVISEVNSPVLDATLLMRPVTGTFDTIGRLVAQDGASNLELVANVNLGLPHCVDLVYAVSYSGLGTGVYLSPFWFAAPKTSGANIDLNTVRRLPQIAIDAAGAS